MSLWVRTFFCAFMATPWMTGCSSIEKFCGGGKAKIVNETKDKKMNPKLDFPAVTREELSKGIAGGNLILIDANGTESYTEGHIPGAMDFEAISHQLAKTLQADTATPLVVYCGGPRCMAWKSAAQALASQGFTNISHYPGGLQEWMETNMPLESAPARPASHKIGAPEIPTNLPSCRLSPKAQASRIGKLRSTLFREIDSIIEEKDKLSFRFADKPENVRELTEFIRFERECCTALRFGLEWEPNGGPVTLEMKGPSPLLKALKEIASSSTL